MNEEALTLDAKRCVLIIQDLQNDVIIDGGAFAETGSPEHAKEQNVVENVKALAETCRAKEIPVIHVHYIVEPGAPGLKLNAPLFQGVKDTGALVRDSWGAAPAEGLEPQDGDFIVQKMRMSAWQGTRLENLLTGFGRDTIIVTGAWTNMSIEHTSRTGRRQGLLHGRARGRLLDDERRLAQRVDQLRAPERLDRDHVRRGHRGARRRPGGRLASVPRRGRACSRPLRLCVRALAVVLPNGCEHVEDERSLRAAVRRVLDPARSHVRLERTELVRLALDDEPEHALEDDAELLVRVAVGRHGRAGLEPDEVEHRPIPEERPRVHALGQLEASDRIQADELRRHALDYR